MNALIVYASMTGNTEKIAYFLDTCFKSMGVDSQVKECQQVNPIEFKIVDICVVATYTYGSAGDLPDEIVGFYEDLGDLDLSGKIFGTLGSGEEDYGYFCKSADDFALQFRKTNAICGAGVVKMEESPDMEDKKRIASFAQEIVKHV